LRLHLRLQHLRLRFRQGATGDKAAAMPSATPTQLGLATADNGLVQKTAVVCGRWGCRRVVRGARVWVGPRRPLYGFARPGWGWSSPAWGWSSVLGDGAGAVRGGAGKLIAMTSGA